MDERWHRHDDHRWLPPASLEHKGLMTPADKQAIAANAEALATLGSTVARLQATLGRIVAALDSNGIKLS